MFESWMKQDAYPFIINVFKASISFLLLFFVVGCAPTLYSVDVKYLTSATTLPTAASGQKFVVTVATFNDIRPGGKDLLIGRVTTAMGGLTSVIPKNMNPPDAVSTIVKDVLVKSGYQVSVTMPAWNLQASAIHKPRATVWARAVHTSKNKLWTKGCLKRPISSVRYPT